MLINFALKSIILQHKTMNLHVILVSFYTFNVNNIIGHLNVSRILIHKGSSCDIMYYGLLEKMWLRFAGIQRHDDSSIGVHRVNGMYRRRERCLVCDFEVPSDPIQKCL